MSIQRKSIFIMSLRRNSVIGVGTWLCLMACVIVSPLYVVMGMGDYLFQKHEFQSKQVTLLIVFFAIPYALSFLVLGPISDRIGRKSVLVFGTFVFSISSFFLAFQSSLESMLGLRSLQGAAAASFTPVAFAYVAETFRQEISRFLTTVITSSLLVSITVSQLYAYHISDTLGWMGIFFGVSLLSATLSFWGFFLLDDQGPPKVNIAVTRNFGFMLTHLKNVLLLRIYFCGSTILFGLVAHFYVLEFDLFGGGNSSSTINAIRVATIPAMLAGFLSGHARARFGDERVILASFSVSALCMVAAFSHSGPHWLTLISFLFVGSLCLAVPILVSNISGLAQGSVGAASALFTFFMFAGAAMGAALGGVSVQISGEAHAFTVLAIVYSAVVVMYWFTSRWN